MQIRNRPLALLMLVMAGLMAALLLRPFGPGGAPVAPLQSLERREPHRSFGGPGGPGVIGERMRRMPGDGAAGRTGGAGFTTEMNAVADRDGVVERKGDSFGFNKERYGATLSARDVAVAGRPPQDGLERPTLRFRLSEVRAGSAILATGSDVTPDVDPKTGVFRYQRAGVEERYTIRDEGLEQEFILRERPAATGDLVIKGVLDSNLESPPMGSASRLSFGRSGKELAFVSDAVVIDAAGRRLPIPIEYDPSRQTMALRVAGDWLSAATFPVIVDPVIGMTREIDSGTQGTFGAIRGVAYGAAGNTWLLVWSEAFGASSFDFDVLGQMIDANGRAKGPTLYIGAGSGQEHQPAVSYAGPADSFCVVWQADPVDNASSADRRIDARLVNGDGTFPGNTFTVDDRAGVSEGAPDLAFDGIQWYACFPVSTLAAPWQSGLNGRFISSSGVPGLRVDPLALGSLGTLGGVAHVGGRYLLGYTRPNTQGIQQVLLRLMDTSGMLVGGEVLADPAEVESQARPALSAGNGVFLVTWHYVNPAGPQRIRGRICTPDLIFQNPPFDINATPFPWHGDNKVAYSATSEQWLVAYEDRAQFQRMYGNRVTSAGTATPWEQLSDHDHDVHGLGLDWNSTRNTMLLAYSQTYPLPTRIYATRYTLSTVPNAQVTPDFPGCV